MLETLGLGTLAEAVYRGILTRAEQDPKTIAESLGAPEPAVRDAMDQLGGLGLLTPSLDDPERLRVISPEVGLQALIQRQEADLLSRRQTLAESQAAVSRLIAEHSLSNAAATTAGRLDLDALHTRLEELTQSISGELLVLRPGNENGMPSLLEATRSHHEAMLARGVSLRAVYRDSVRNNIQTRAHAHWLTSAGGQLRTAPTVPLWMAIADGKLALLSADPDDFDAGVIQVTGTGVLSALTDLFERIWHIGSPLDTSGERDDSGLTAAEREILGLLTQGLTDEAAARKLGVSLRTVRRVMSDLMNRLGARSRFEAGFLVAERRWLKP